MMSWAQREVASWSQNAMFKKAQRNGDAKRTIVWSGVFPFLGCFHWRGHFPSVVLKFQVTVHKEHPISGSKSKKVVSSSVCPQHRQHMQQTSQVNRPTSGTVDASVCTAIIHHNKSMTDWAVHRTLPFTGPRVFGAPTHAVAHTVFPGKDTTWTPAGPTVVGFSIRTGKGLTKATVPSRPPLVQDNQDFHRGVTNRQWRWDAFAFRVVLVDNSKSFWSQFEQVSQGITTTASKGFSKWFKIRCVSVCHWYCQDWQTHWMFLWCHSLQTSRSFLAVCTWPDPFTVKITMKLDC